MLAETWTGLCIYVDSLLIKSFMKERKRGKENIPLMLWYLNTGENFVVVNVQYKAFIVILRRYPLSNIPCPLKEMLLSNIYRDREIEYKDIYIKLPLRRNRKGKRGTFFYYCFTLIRAKILWWIIYSIYKWNVYNQNVYKQ